MEYRRKVRSRASRHTVFLPQRHFSPEEKKWLERFLAGVKTAENRKKLPIKNIIEAFTVTGSIWFPDKYKSLYGPL
jgi:hypothetical protein